MKIQGKIVTFSKSWQCRCINMAETRKQIAFDLDTKALETYYPSEHWRDCREANIGKEHSKNYIFDKNATVSVREGRNVPRDNSD